jgi:hypothetical protein
MGWSLCQTPDGQRLIRRMILDDIGGARRRGDARTAAAERERALLHFTGAHRAR